MNKREAPATDSLESYLARLEAALAPVPTADRQDILMEMRSHVVERTRRAPFRSAEEVLAELGPPEAYARQFLPEEEVAAPARRPDSLRGIARLATGGLAKLPLLFVVVAAYAIALFTFLLAVAKLMEPDATGLFVSNTPAGRSVMLVWSHPNHGGRDVLGYGLVPLALLISIAIHLAMSALLRRVLRRDQRVGQPRGVR